VAVISPKVSRVERARRVGGHRPLEAQQARPLEARAVTESRRRHGQRRCLRRGAQAGRRCRSDPSRRHGSRGTARRRRRAASPRCARWRPLPRRAAAAEKSKTASVAPQAGSSRRPSMVIGSEMRSAGSGAAAISVAVSAVATSICGSFACSRAGDNCYTSRWSSAGQEVVLLAVGAIEVDTGCRGRRVGAESHRWRDMLVRRARSPHVRGVGLVHRDHEGERARLRVHERQRVRRATIAASAESVRRRAEQAVAPRAAAQGGAAGGAAGSGTGGAATGGGTGGASGGSAAARCWLDGGPLTPLPQPVREPAIVIDDGGFNVGATLRADDGPVGRERRRRDHAHPPVAAL